MKYKRKEFSDQIPTFLYFHLILLTNYPVDVGLGGKKDGAKSKVIRPKTVLPYLKRPKSYPDHLHTNTYA